VFVSVIKLVDMICEKNLKDVIATTLCDFCFSDGFLQPYILRIASESSYL